MKKFKILESIDSVVVCDRFLVNMTCLGGDIVIKNKNQSVDDLFPGVDGGCRNDYFVALLRLLVIDEYVRSCGVVDFDFIGIDDDFFVSHDGIASGHFIDSVDGFREYSFNLVDVIGGIKNFDKNGSIGLMYGVLGFGCLEQFIIGCLGGGNNISANYWSKFKKFLVVNNLLLGVKGNYVGFNYERISDIFFGGVCDSFGIEFSLDEFFSYGLRDNVANSFNWKICFVDDSGKKKMVFKFNPYINIGTGEVYFDSFDKLRKDFVSGLISEGDFLVRNINYGGDCKDFVNGLRALQVDDFVIRSGFDSDLVNNSSIDNSSIDNSLLQEKLVRNNYRNRMCVKNYISYQRIADLLGYANKMGAWYMMQNQSMVILRNDRIEFAANAGVMDVVKTFGLGIHEVLSESDMAKKSKKKLKKNSKVLLLKEDKKDSNEEDLDGGLLVDFDSDLPILPKFGKTIEFVEEKLESFTKMQVSGMDLLNLQITETESIDNYLQVSLVKDNYVGKFAESFTDNKPSKKSINSDDFQQILNLCNDWVLEISELDVFKFENDEIHGADEKVIYYDRDEKLTEVEFLWLKDLFGDIVIGMSHPERNELFRCMMKNDKDIFGSFRIKRYLYDDLCENSLWKKAYELEIAERISNFKKSSQYFRWNLEFLNLGCLKSKEFIDIEMSKIVMDSLNKKYFGIDGNVIERKILRKKMVSEFGIFGLVNKLMNEISVIGIENFRKSRGLGNDFVENLKRDFVGDFNDLLQKMYLPCCVYKNKAGNLEVNYISEIRKIGNRNSVRNSSIGNSKEFPTSIVEYTQIVRNLTENVYKNNYELLNPNKLERSVIDSDFTCQLDHKYSIENGFVNGICPSVIASVENLEILPVLFNQIKGVKNSISLKELQRKIQEVA